MCSVLHACLIVAACWDGFLKCVGSADANRFIDKGTIYEIYNDETDFSNADSVCKRDNGRLSKIIPEPGAYILNDPMSEFLRPRIGDSCVWDGSSDRESEGNWAWTDGNPVDFNWQVDPQKVSQHDCGRLCLEHNQWVWRHDNCEKSSKFVCELEKHVTTPEPEPEPKLKDEETKHLVVTRMPENKQIIGKPLFATSAPMATVCSRICTKQETCAMFNFNMASRQCRGYTRSPSITYKKNANWEVWILKGV